MASRKVRLFPIVAFAALVAARPQDDVGKVMQQASGGLPFLEFKNGGVRVNFGGYHAQAGLGGLLGGSGTGGGLHASAGTPSGAHASAGLGGLLGGDSAGGGLHARAGLGNGGPEAGAGLGGALGGNAESPAQGGLYAGATPGNLAIQKRKIARTNVQFVSRPEVQKVKEVEVVNSAFANAAVDASAAKPIVKETQFVQPQTEVRVQPVVSAGISGGLYAGVGGTTSREKSVEKVKISNGKVHIVEKGVSAQPVPVAAQGEVYGNAETAVEGNGNVANIQTFPARWYLRKRYRAGPYRKVYYRTQVLPADAQPATSVTADVSGGFSSSVSGQAAADTQYSVTGYKGSTLFDDIFNIPISTLSAVNQLLNNKAG